MKFVQEFAAMHVCGCLAIFGFALAGWPWAALASLVVYGIVLVRWGMNQA
jgi:hypothetical protein